MHGDDGADMKLLALELPWWARWAALAAAGALVFLLGQLHGERIAGQIHVDYVTGQAAQTVKIARAQQVVVTQTEIKYRDRIQKIYVKGDVIEKEVPVYVTQTDNDRCTINAGFVRSFDAAWTGEPAGSAGQSDREPAAVSLAEVGQTNAFNATACLAWREQSLGLLEFYRKLQAATNMPP